MRKLLALILLSATPAVADPLFGVPIACPENETCFIQNYVDRDPGPDYSDFTCGALSYDGHKGTDFAVPTRTAMERGVPVLAAAAGVVTGLRDGMPDSGITADTADALAGRECGNGVVVDHGQGWVSQYCHMRRGSVRVQEGQILDAGDQIGEIGQSGMAAFPHLHFSVRKDGRRVDPFSPDAAQCGETGKTLWSSDIPYQPGGVLGVALSDHVPSFDQVKLDGGGAAIGTSSPALVIVTHLFGAREGDMLHMTLAGPDGQIADQSVQLPKNQARLFRATGRKARGAWPKGTYIGTATLMRDGVAISTVSITQQMR